MPLPFPSTVARDRVIANARYLEETEGWDRGRAYAEAFRQARKAYFKQYPQGLLPGWLAVAKDKRHRDDYTADGVAYRKAQYAENPAKRAVSVRAAARLYEGFTGDAPRTSVTVNIPGVDWKAGFIVGHVLGFELDIGKYTFAANDKGGLPALVVSATGAQVAFLGGDYRPLLDWAKRGDPYGDEPLDNPKILAIMYRTVRDGRTENYRHPFAPHAQPALSVLDARNAKMNGGSFRFTDRGFVDKPRNRA